ncbi:MAG: class I SAM-dependent methyltransferase [Gemmataceae bacterium]|nr:class I SAM-dependent methyltransferase [Gemmataceae bacterium]
MMFHPQGPTLWELAVQALSSTERGYDLLAPKFDYTPFRTPDEVLDVVGTALESLAPFASGLDICCGTGAAMRMLRPLCRERVVGLDVSAGMLSVAQRVLADAPGTAPLEFVRGDALAMPFDAAFDVAVCFGAFGHILVQDEEAFVRQVARVLRPGGRFVFVTSPMPSWWDPTYWMRRGFNAVMHMRNWLRSPPFIMFYLTFLLPGAGALLEANGFDVEVRDAKFAWPFTPLRLVIATRRPAALGLPAATGW